MGKIVFGIIFIIGGASGYLVLRGTDSSFALILVGIGLLVWGIIQIARGNDITGNTTMVMKKEPIPNNKIIETRELNTPNQTTQEERSYNCIIPSVVSESYFDSNSSYSIELKNRWINGSYNGNGTLLYSDGYKYNGDWKNSLRDGVGILYYSSDCKKDEYMYKGEWKDDKFHGNGSFFARDKSLIYSGKWENGKIV